jgi:predicted ribosome quality control (RQC) complex YloA/Tae2 family protein
MYKNYFFLNRLIVEFNNELKGFTVNQIFSQEKDKLFLNCINGKDERYIEISVNPGFPFINLRSHFNRAKKNTIDFFSDVLPDKIVSFEIADNDRIIRIKLEHSSLYFAVRGKFTNVHLIDSSENINSFKKEENDILENFVIEISKINFVSHFNIPDFKKISYETNFEKTKHDYPILGKEIILETKARCNDDSSEIVDTIRNILNEIRISKVAIFDDQNQRKLHLAFQNFISIPFTNKQYYNTAVEALNAYLSQLFYLEETEIKRKTIERTLDREQNRLSGKINGIKNYLDSGSKVKLYEKYGDLLLINLNNIQAGMEEVIVEDIYENNQKIKIKLDKTRNSKQNADLYFKRSKEEKVRYNKSKEIFQISVVRFERLRAIREKLNQSNELREINIIMKELKIKTQQATKEKEDISSKFRHYIIEGKYDVYVGKDSKNNDLLTTKFAKQNDYWFHARSISGSHVVLRIQNTKENMPKSILKKAASIAAYYSKAKTSGTAPVSFTQKKYVIKKKGMDPGKVALLREEVLLVKPEIPLGCKYESVEND